MSVSEDGLFEQFGGAITKLNISENFASEIVEAMNGSQKAAQEAIRAPSASYKAALSKLDESENKAWGAYEEGILDKDGYQKRMQHIWSQRQE
jgi:hypothetical protein